MIRINKYLSICGVTSRRGAEALIAQRRVVVNDKAVEKLGTIIDEENDVIKVDGTIVSPTSEKLCILLYKPKRVMTTLHDPFRRKTVADYKPSKFEFVEWDTWVKGKNTTLLVSNNG